jgi:hypothetical protein
VQSVTASADSKEHTNDTLHATRKFIYERLSEKCVVSDLGYAKHIVMPLGILTVSHMFNAISYSN